jgi:hypothetical protein
MARYNNSYRKSYRNYTPRSVRKRQERSQKRLIWNIILGVVLIYVIFFWALPALIGGLSIFHKSTPNSASNNTQAKITLAPPVLNIPYEATSSASISVNGYSNPDTKVQIYLDDNLKTTATTNSDGTFKTDQVDLDLGTNNIYGKTIDDSGGSSLPSKTIQVTYNNQKPALTISSPDENNQIHGGDKKVTVSGSTDPNDNISVNGQTVIVDSSGNFSVSISINDGDNTITVTATDQVGNTTQAQRKVTYSSS